MKNSIVQTKLQRPTMAPDIVPRGRLLDRLAEGRSRPLTLISAPAGYGKSTLASLWASSCDWPSGWITLDENDSDLRTFLSYLLTGVQSMFPDAALRTGALLAAGQLPAVGDLAGYLLNDLHQVTQPFILVLDDYHHIGRPSVHELVSALLEHPPQAMHLVLLTRRDPALPIAKMRGRGQVTEIRAADLRFTPAETAAFLTVMLKAPVDDATAALLETKTEGWATGLRLAALYLGNQKDLEKAVRKLNGNSRHIAEYLISEVLSGQDPEIAACLVETSILNRFCASLCRAVHSKNIEDLKEKRDRDARQFIQWLIEANIFVIPLDDQGYWFRYHRLFQEFLQALLRKQTAPDTVAELHRLAANWFAENGLIDEAIQHALAAGDTQAAVRLVIEHRCNLMNSSQFFRLSRWLRSLPEEAVAENPLLMMTRAFLGHEIGPDSDAYTCTEQVRRKADALPAESADSSTLNGEIALMQSLQDVILGQPDSAIAQAQKALQLLPRQTFYARSLAIGAVAAGHQMAGDCSHGVKLLRDSLTDPDWPAGIRTRVWLYICVLKFMDADASGVLFSGRECLKITGATQFIQPRSSAQYYLGAIHYLRNELAEAKHYLTDVMSNRAVSEAAFVVQASGILAFIHLAEGCPAEARNIIESVNTNGCQMQDGYALVTRDALLAEVALRQGKIDEAHRLSVHVDFDLRPPHWFLYVPQLTNVKLLLAQNTDESLKKAHARLVEMNAEMDRIHRKGVRIDVLALLALVCHKMGAEAAALENLQLALALAEPGGFTRNFVDLGVPMRELLERLIQAQPRHKYAQQVLAACEAEARKDGAMDTEAEQRPGLAGQAPLRILTPRETEILHLLADGPSNKEIGAKLHIATETVKTHLQNIYAKLKATNRIGALKEGRRLGMITLDRSETTGFKHKILKTNALNEASIQ